MNKSSDFEISLAGQYGSLLFDSMINGKNSEKTSFGNEVRMFGNMNIVKYLEMTDEEKDKALDQAMQMREYIVCCHFFFEKQKNKGVKEKSDFIKDFIGCISYVYDNCDDEILGRAYEDNGIISKNYLFSGFQIHLFNMFRIAKHDPSVRALLNGLYKKWFPEDWKIFKRFNKLKSSDMEALLEEDDRDYGFFYRISVFFYINDIEIEEEVKSFFVYRNGFFSENTIDGKVSTDDEKVALEEIKEKIKEKYREGEGRREIKQQIKYLTRVFELFAVPESFTIMDIDLIEDEELMIHLLTYCYKACNKKEIDLAELAKYLPSVYGAHIADALNTEAYWSFFINYTNYPEWAPKISEKKAVMSEFALNTSESNEAEQAIIDELNEKIKNLESEVSIQKSKFNNIKSLYKELKEENESLKDLLGEKDEDSENDDGEDVLVIEEEDTESEEDPISFEEKVKYLNNEKCCFVGGADKRLIKMKEYLTNWIMVPTHSETLNTSCLNSVKYVFVYPKYLDHATYYRVVNRAKEMGKTIDFVYGVNLENTIDKMYKSLKGIA